MPTNDYEDLDKILDAGLATYSEREPWPGIEDRVLAKLAPAAPRYRWLRYLTPIPVLAAVLALLLYSPSRDARRASAPPKPVVEGGETKHDLQPAPLTAAKLPHSRKPFPIRKRTARPSVFPTPSPLTVEERVLLQLARSRPEVMEDLSIRKQHQDQPVSVEPLEIPPL